MSRYHSYINSASEILHVYHGQEPFSSFLKKYFSTHKKFGSTDRKQVAHLCYCYFRLGKAAKSLTIEERILLGLFLCSERSGQLLGALKPAWNDKAGCSPEEKMSSIGDALLINDVFPWKDQLSNGLDHEKLCKSFFIQPELFIRLRPGKERIVADKLRKAGIDFRHITENCLALSNTTKLDEIIELDREAVVQDHNSQRTGEIIKYQISIPIGIGIKSQINLWDCCAGSGGKSIMIYDINPKIELTVSDVRESILVNLKKRFARAGIENYKSFTADLATSNFQFSIPIAIGINYQLIIADVPCTGSGTWSRTPEQLYFFDEKKVDEYATIQKTIVSNAIPKLEPGGAFIYITCSVFKKENEEMVDYIREKFHLQLRQMELLKGYDKKADSMFVAVFEK